MTRLSDLDMLSDLEALDKSVRGGGIAIDNMPEDWRRASKAMRIGSASKERARNFYDRGTRPEPSLPRLKFLEGKD